MNISFDSILEARQLSIGYLNRNEKVTVLSDIELNIYKGEIVCLIGPNGCGKSTLIRTLAGMQPHLSGYCNIAGKQVNAENATMLAQQLSVVLTDRVEAGNLTVYDIVSIGRYPYTNWLGTQNEADDAIILKALEHVGLSTMKGNSFSHLSDGEKQRVMIAKALAQDTPLIMLDEPTAHLDLPNRVEIMKLLRELAHKTHKSILLSTHELDLALQAADRIWLMRPHKAIIIGTPEDLVLNGSFEEAFRKQSFTFDIATGTFKINYQQRKAVQLKGDDIQCFWTKRALERHGFYVTDDAAVRIIATSDKWEISLADNDLTVCNTILDLLKILSVV
ncbi:MAG: ABC transporter ATP-binding protein [Bacteroidales bacterium]|nr:ABC transporter ATP-binding protein [Bacteroidales bacterium]